VKTVGGFTLRNEKQTCRKNALVLSALQFSL